MMQAECASFDKIPPSVQSKENAKKSSNQYDPCATMV